ncbi:hypothetical protein [Rubrivivax rivuli]|uniref:Lipoprotein n=1 Tax=Rubrivivax rivuli TaxID=1862385 RepID=A0A437RHW3_9BURK|nr:hypothetical protein [Rubrivivax rivuli]RVU46356.1 hypothetical protein EOE66_10975 [Rubrivivax rivuli]
MRAAWMSVAALAAAVALSACTEKPQTSGQRKSDQAPYATANSSNTAGTWKEGDSKAWERQLSTRAQNGQNEYSRASAP